MKYEQPQPITIDAAERLVDKPEALAQAIIAISLYHARATEAQAFCVRFAQHDNATVRGNALLALGHLARRHRVLDRKVCEPLLRKGLEDPSAYVRGHAISALDDIKQFLSRS